MRVCYSELGPVDFGLEFEEGDSPKLVRIMKGALVGALERFAFKNRGYTSAQDRFPGSVTGEYFQIERKVGKLYAGFILGDDSAWDAESPEEVMDDLLGHILLMKDHWNRGEIK